MEKSNFKKMALMGMAAGTLLTAQTPVNADIVDNVQSMIIAKSCGGSNGGSCNARSSCSSGRPRQSYTADATPSSMQQQPHQMQYNQPQYQQSRQENLSESEFISQLNDESKAIFRGLDAEGKALALRLAQESHYKDKNQVVRLAAQKIAEQRAGRPDAHHGYGY